MLAYKVSVRVYVSVAALVSHVIVGDARVEIRRVDDSGDPDSEDSFVGGSLNCEMMSFAIPSSLEGHPSPRLPCTVYMVCM